MAQTPTIQDILSSYQEGVGSGGTNTALLLQALRNRQIRAGEEDKQTAKSFHSGGKAFLSGSKHARDFFSMFQGFSQNMLKRCQTCQKHARVKVVKACANLVKACKSLRKQGVGMF